MSPVASHDSEGSDSEDGEGSEEGPVAEHVRCRLRCEVYLLWVGLKSGGMLAQVSIVRSWLYSLVSYQQIYR